MSAFAAYLVPVAASSDLDGCPVFHHTRVARPKVKASTEMVETEDLIACGICLVAWKNRELVLFRVPSLFETLSLSCIADSPCCMDLPKGICLEDLHGIRIQLAIFLCL